MDYYISKKVETSFSETLDRVQEELRNEGFGVLTQIDVQQTLKEKLGAEYPRYQILGACNPPYAHKALMADDKIGTMLPCNVIVQEHVGGQVEIAAINPVVSMRNSENQIIKEIAYLISEKLNSAISRSAMN